MTIKFGMVMDPIQTIKTYKDSSFAMLLAAQAKGWELYYMEPQDLFARDGRAYARTRRLTVVDQKTDYYTFLDEETRPLGDLDVIIMRQDPPFNMEYIYSTYMLELAENEGTLVINKPSGLRDANEKFSTSLFPQCTPPTLFTREQSRLREFLAEHQDIIVKPLDMMGGHSIFRVIADSPNIGVIFETMTQHDSTLTVAQKYVPAISETGDKRILLINGEPVPYALARMQADGETRANIAAGGTPIARPFTERDHWICAQVGPFLRDNGFFFVGIDVIGDYLTEINVTSATGIRELDTQIGLDIGTQLMDAIEIQINAQNG